MGAYVLTFTSCYVEIVNQRLKTFRMIYHMSNYSECWFFTIFRGTFNDVIGALIYDLRKIMIVTRIGGQNPFEWCITCRLYKIKNFSQFCRGVCNDVMGLKLKKLHLNISKLLIGIKNHNCLCWQVRHPKFDNYFYRSTLLWLNDIKKKLR